MWAAQLRARRVWRLGRGGCGAAGASHAPDALCAGELLCEARVELARLLGKVGAREAPILRRARRRSAAPRRRGHGAERLRGRDGRVVTRDSDPASVATPSSHRVAARAARGWGGGTGARGAQGAARVPAARCTARFHTRKGSI